MAALLTESLERIALHDHVGLFARGRQEALPGIVPFLQAGMSRGEKCILACDAAFGRMVLNGLQAKGTDVAGALQRGSLLVARDPGADSGNLAPPGDLWIESLRGAFRLASSERYPALRACIETSFVLSGDVTRASVIAWLGKLSAFLAENRCLALSVHDEASLSPEILNDTLRAHPFVIHDGRLLENFYYVPPSPATGEIGPWREFPERLRHLAERHEQLSRIRRQALRQTRLRDITMSLLAHAAVPDLLKSITEGLVSLGYRMCWIGMAMPDGVVTPAVACGDKGGYLREIRVRWDDTAEGKGPVGAAIRERRPEIIHDITRSRRFAPWRDKAIQKGFLSVAAIPLREEEKVVGALAVYAGEKYVFDKEAVEELSAFALQASLALQRAREYRQLSNSEDRLRRLFEQIPAACFTFDEEGVIRDWNFHCCRLFGYSVQEAVGSPAGRLQVRPGDREASERIHSRVFAGESLFNLEWEFLSSSGERRWILSNAYPYRGPSDRVELGISVNVDITGQVEARRALRESEEKFRTVVEDANVFAVEMDPSFRIRMFNRTAERVTGYGADEVAGVDFLDRFVPERERARVASMLREVLGGREAEGMALTIATRDGRERILRWNAKALHTAQDELRGIVCLGGDVTERIRIDDEKEEIRRRLDQVRRMEALGALAGGIANEFNNILGSIIGYGSFLQSQMDPGHSFEEPVGRMRAAAERASDLALKLLGFARVGKGANRRFSPTDVAQRVASVIARDFPDGIGIRTVFAPDPPLVEGDEEQVEQSLLHLCMNARDAMPGGGTLTIATGVVDMGPDDVRKNHVGGPGEYVVLEVRDTGIGMSDEVRERVFDPLFTTKKEKGRMGLGLPMIYGIVKNHNGGIIVESAPGKGSAFRIHLPALAAQAPEDREPPQGEGPYPRGTETVLIVDDEDGIRTMGESLLGNLGYRVLLAEEGEEACRIVRETGGEIHLVLLDIIMPRMGGRETFYALRKIAPGVPVLLSSGYTAEDVALELLNEGADGFLQKPYGISELARTVRSVLDARQRQ